MKKQHKYKCKIKSEQDFVDFEEFKLGFQFSLSDKIFELKDKGFSLEEIERIIGFNKDDE